MLDKDLEKIKNLEKKEIDLIITDFDDTIFCRKEQLENSEILRNNRWNKWNDMIINEIGIENFINQFYINKKYPDTITSKLRKNHDLILTAWYNQIQNAKLKSTWLDIFNFRVVKEASNKINSTIDYIVNVLWYIPNKITVYEDRPKYFIENKEFLENTLWTKLEIMFVEMIDNQSIPKITKLDKKNK